MKLIEVPMVVTSLVGLCFLAGPEVPAARADFAFGEPAHLDTVMPFVTIADSSVECFSSDGLEMFINSTRAGGSGNYDLWVCKRASPEEAWGPPENLGPAVNSAQVDAGSSITADGLELYFFSSSRPGGSGSGDIYVTKRVTRNSPWGPATNLGAPVNTSGGEYATSVSSDGLELYLMCGAKRGGYGSFDLWVSKRATRNDPWGDPVNLGATVNSSFTEDSPCLSPDGLLLIFQDAGKPRPGGSGGGDLWMTQRASRSASWEPVVSLGPTVNGPTGEYMPRLAPDGSALYFIRDGFPYLIKTPILPIVDFNADGNVDLDDLRLLIDIDNWGTDNTLYDIGPYAWGDGVVDIEDLKVFTTEWEKANPPAQP